jgi:hypothetical protein
LGNSEGSKEYKSIFVGKVPEGDGVLNKAKEVMLNGFCGR